MPAHAVPSTPEQFNLGPRLRLATGAPALVDRKSIPYLDTDVVEWSDRLRLVDWFYREEPEGVSCAQIDTLAEQYGVTHLVPDEDLLDLPSVSRGLPGLTLRSPRGHRPMMRPTDSACSVADADA